MDELRPKLEKVLADLRAELVGLRTGRATPALVEGMAVEAYGGRQPLKALAAISTPEPRSLLIQPWDRSLLPAIEKAIQASPLGLAPIADRDAIRLTLPMLTEERKRDLVRLSREKLEASRINLRRLRDEAMKAIDAREKAGEISEDERFRSRQEVEKTVGEYNRKIEEMGAAKEREIMAG